MKVQRARILRQMNLAAWLIRTWFTCVEHATVQIWLPACVCEIIDMHVSLRVQES